MPNLDLRACVRWFVVILAVMGVGRAVFSADLQYPLSIAGTSGGKIYLADRNLPGIWIVQDGKLSLLVQGSKKFRTPLNAIRCVAVDEQGTLYAGDSSTRDVYQIDDKGELKALTYQPAAADSSASSEKDAPAASTDAKTDEAAKSGRSSNARFQFGQIGIPMDLAVTADGEIFVSDLEIHRIVKIPQGGGEAKEFAQVAAPRGICLDAEKSLWVVSGRRLVKISPEGQKTTVVEDGVFEFPHTVAVAQDGTAFVCDGYAKAIWKVPAGGKPEKLASGEPLINPVGMRLVGDKLLVVDPRAAGVFLFEVSLDGKITPIPFSP